MRRLLSVSISVVLLIIGLGVGHAKAADSPLDLSFNSSGSTPGIFTTTFGGGYALARSVLVDSQGRIVIGGESDLNGGSVTLTRLTPNGILDTSFGVNGVTTTSSDLLGATNFIFDREGRILAGGYSQVSGEFKATIIRYTSDGVLDTSFGTNGRVRTEFRVAYSLAVDELGRIVAGGFDWDAQYNSFFKVARLSDAGVLDSTFGVNGIATGSVNGDIFAMTIDNTGKIVVGGRSQSNFAIARYTITGVLDSTFGTNGVTTTPSAGSNFISSIALDSVGRIVAGGGSVFSASKLVRYTSNGILDASFGVNGVVTPINLGGIGVAIDSQDGVLIGGAVPSGLIKPYAVARYTSAGILDSTFGSSGIKSVEVGISETGMMGGGYPNVYSVTLDGQGNILLVGDSKLNNQRHLTVVRFLGQSVVVAVNSALAAAATAEADAARREAERKVARIEIASKFEAAEKVTIEVFRQADIVVSLDDFDEVVEEILALPEALRADIAQVIKVAYKYEVVGKLSSDMVKTVYPKELIAIGLIPAESRYKATLTAILQKLPASLRSDYSAIKALLDAAMKKIEVRNLRVAEFRSRSAG